MKSIKNIVCICALSLALFACERETPTPPVDPPAPLLALDTIAPVSLGYEAANEVKVSVSKIIERSDISVTADDSWVRDISVKEQTISFMVSENPERTRGYRYLNILIKQEGKEIGRCKVYQSRRPISEEKLAFATEKASNNLSDYFSDIEERDGLEMTKFVYNLEKTTGGKDNYKNYPAFAFCIDMNYDPENNMEWFLPSQNDVYLSDYKYLTNINNNI